MKAPRKIRAGFLLCLISTTMIGIGSALPDAAAEGQCRDCMETCMILGGSFSECLETVCAEACQVIL